MNKMNFEKFLSRISNSNDYFKNDFRKMQIEKEIEEKVNYIIDEDKLEDVEIYNAIYIAIAEDVMTSEKRLRLFETLKAFSDVLDIKVTSKFSSNFNDGEFKVKINPSSLIDLSENDTKKVYETLSKIYSDLIKKSKNIFPYLLTGKVFDDVFLWPLQEYLYCCECNFDGEEVEATLFFENDNKDVHLLSYREIFNILFEEYFKNLRKKVMIEGSKVYVRD